LHKHIITYFEIKNNISQNSAKFSKTETKWRNELGLLMAWEDCCKKDQRSNNEIRWKTEEPILFLYVMCVTLRLCFHMNTISLVLEVISQQCDRVGFVLKATLDTINQSCRETTFKITLHE